MVIAMVMNKFDLKLTTEVPQMVSVRFNAVLCTALLTSCDTHHYWSDAKTV